MDFKNILNLSLYSSLLVLWLVISVEEVTAGKDYYQLLGISRDATERDIKKAFRKLAMKYHPDKNKAKDAEDKFREIAKAYEVLSDKEKRKSYDQFGDEEENGRFSGSGNGPHFDFNEFFRDFDQAFNHHQQHQQHHGFHHGFNRNHDHDHDHDHNHYNDHFRAHSQSHSRHHFNFNFDDLFDDMEREEFGSFGNFFGHQSADTFGDGNSFFGGNHFQGIRMNAFSSNSRHDERCRTVTKRMGNSVMTYTECS